MDRAVAIAVLMSLLVIGGCSTTAEPDVIGAGTQLEIRQIQTRAYDTLDKRMTMRSIVATLQDLGFTIDEADLDLGAVTATRLDRYTMRMTVTAAEKDNDQISVRANARIVDRTVDDPATYQDFFVVLDKAMFLTMNNVD